MLAGKKLNDFTNTFSPHDFDKNDVIISKMNEIDNTNFSEQTKFQLN